MTEETNLLYDFLISNSSNLAIICKYKNSFGTMKFESLKDLLAELPEGDTSDESDAEEKDAFAAVELFSISFDLSPSTAKEIAMIRFDCSFNNRDECLLNGTVKYTQRAEGDKYRILLVAQHLMAVAIRQMRSLDP